MTEPFFIPIEKLKYIEPKNDLEQIFLKNKKRKIFKWFHYFEIYDKFFSKFRDKEINILEIGVFNGGSLQMWKEYFGPKCKIYGVDILEDCKKYEEENIEILIGAQEDVTFLNKIKLSCPQFDIIIDDGGHHMNQQITTYNELFPHLKEGGVYICEDIHTSYWDVYGGEYKGNNFVEYSKNFIDEIHFWYSSKIKETYESKNIFGIHFYDSMLVLEKRNIKRPFNTITGEY